MGHPSALAHSLRFIDCCVWTGLHRNSSSLAAAAFHITISADAPLHARYIKYRRVIADRRDVSFIRLV